ncbi:hypothetical protein ON010_g9719 [Phytophthora cinnamomi]|nr:hypothetical protein ON010_g9719 [Phytophthora cinnamomi]
MYAAVREIARRGHQSLLLTDAEAHFKNQFHSPQRRAITPDCNPRPLTYPIRVDEVDAAFCRLNNGRASGPDDISAELLKYGSSVLAPPPTSLRLSTTALHKASPSNSVRARYYVFRSPTSQEESAQVFARLYFSTASHRSTADAVWARKWLCARVQRYRETIHILGIELSRAFDTIDREKLLDVLETFLQEDEIRLIKLLLADSTLSLRTGSKTLQPFISNIGTPQGDSLSPVLFVIYLEAALRDLASHLAVPRNLLEKMVVYADDADFICRDPKLAERIQQEAPSVLQRWSLTMNESKTELTILQRFVGPSGSIGAVNLSQSLKSDKGDSRGPQDALLSHEVVKLLQVFIEEKDLNVLDECYLVLFVVCRIAHEYIVLRKAE